jgi:hypothetical protein
MDPVAAVVPKGSLSQRHHGVVADRLRTDLHEAVAASAVRERRRRARHALAGAIADEVVDEQLVVRMTRGAGEVIEVVVAEGRGGHARGALLVFHRRDPARLVEAVAADHTGKRDALDAPVEVVDALVALAVAPRPLLHFAEREVLRVGDHRHAIHCDAGDLVVRVAVRDRLVARGLDGEFVQAS